MKSVMTFLISVFDTWGRARAATTLARMGRYQEAQDLMASKT